MPTLHLPAAHTDTDVALATEVAHVDRQPRALRDVDARRGPGPAAGGRDADAGRGAGERRSRPSPRSSSRWSRASPRSGTRSCTRRARVLSCPRRATTAAHRARRTPSPRPSAPRRKRLPSAFSRHLRVKPLRTARGTRGLGRLRLLALGRLGALAGPGLVELDAPAALFGLHQRELGAEGAAGAALEAGHGLLGAALGDQLAGDRRRQRLARLALPDHEAAARILARPSRRSPCGSRRCRGRRPGRGRGWPAGSGCP